MSSLFGHYNVRPWKNSGQVPYMIQLLRRLDCSYVSTRLRQLMKRDCMPPRNLKYMSRMRGAENAVRLQGNFYVLDDAELELQCQACRSHSDGLTDADITVRTCWDADRLDLGRVGINPSAEKLCTIAARDPGIMEWAYQRSVRLKFDFNFLWGIEKHREF